MEAAFDPMVELRRLMALPRDHRDRLNPHGADAFDAIEALERVEELSAHLHALQAELLVAAAGLEPTTDEFILEPAEGTRLAEGDRTVRISDASRDEIAAALRWSSAFAAARIGQARLLVGHLPGTFEALRRGRISPRHAIVIAEAALRFSHRDARTDEGRAVFADSCAALESRVLSVACRTTVARTVAAGRRAVARIDADHRRRQALARRTRDVTMFEDTDGISCVVARLSTPAAHALVDAVQRHSRFIEDPALTAGERRAHALMALVFGDTAPEVRLDIVLTQETDALGWVASLRDSDVEPAALRDLMSDPKVDTTLRRIAVDRITGQLSGVGRTSYRLPQRLRDFISQRDKTCRFPGCGRQAELGQIDHAVPWQAGGSSDADNLGSLCVRHHQLKTHGGWRILASEPDGSCTWQSPQGRRYRRRAPELGEAPIEARLASVLATARVSAEPQSTSCRSTHADPEPPPF